MTVIILDVEGYFARRAASSGAAVSNDERRHRFQWSGGFVRHLVEQHDRQRKDNRVITPSFHHNHQDLACLKDLLPFEPPAQGQYFDVNVSLAASPVNFYVQPWSEGILLEEQTTRMQAAYQDESQAPPLATAEDLKSNKVTGCLQERINNVMFLCLVVLRRSTHGRLVVQSEGQLRLGRHHGGRQVNKCRKHNNAKLSLQAGRFWRLDRGD